MQKLIYEGTIIENPVGSMRVLSAYEVQRLEDTSSTGLYSLFRSCALAVLNCDNSTDDPNLILKRYADFDIRIRQEHRGLKLEIINPPMCAVVNSKLILGVKENLFSVLRDVLYVSTHISNAKRYSGLLSETNNNLSDIYSSHSKYSAETSLIFEILRNANIFERQELPNKVVCWGGHSILKSEYDYAKKVGYQLGLRKLNIITGCGPGAMKAPMKGAVIAHCKQRFDGRFIGLTEPSIIAAESPNPVVKELVILPDMEKRLEAFVRLGHAIIIFPGGTGTCEELLYILGVLLDEENKHIPLPIILTGPADAENYFAIIDKFIRSCLGDKVTDKYHIIIDNPAKVADYVEKSIETICQFRRKYEDAYYFNWSLKINPDFQQPFVANHKNMRALNIDSNQSVYEQAVNLRKLMSGIVAGNIKEEGISNVKQYGPYEINVSGSLADEIDFLLQEFIRQKRMKMQDEYQPCYKIIRS